MDQALWRAYFDQSPDGFLILDGEGLVGRNNRSFLRLSGQAETDVLGAPWETLLQHMIMAPPLEVAVGQQNRHGLGQLSPSGLEVSFTHTHIHQGHGPLAGGIVCIRPLLRDAHVDHWLTRQLGELEATQVIMVNALAWLAERRDPDIGDHLERVRFYTYSVATRLVGRRDLPSTEELVQLSRVAVLHDLGKIGIPAEILFKPAALSVEEYEVVKKHPLYGAEFLEQTESSLKRLLNADRSFLTMAREISLHHHERYDGTGYPERLCAEEIPLSARVVALTDVYDALTSTRVYKRPWSREEAGDLLRKEAGRHFDPEVVRAFCDAEEEFDIIRTTLNDSDRTLRR